MPLISVVIPCFNASRWLQPAVESVLHQSIGDLEILVYDDGSTDRSADVIERLSKTDSRIKAMGGPVNRGIVHALNSMLDVASGDYIARMDADDISLPHRFEEQLQLLQSGRADLCGTWFREFGHGPPRSARWPCGSEAVRAAMLFQNTICHPTVMAKREVFSAIRYREEYRLAEDYDLFVRALARFRLANLPEVLLRYRRHGQQATRASRDTMQEVTCRVRADALRSQGIHASQEEVRTHNLVRAPRSIESAEDLQRIEAWLLKLLEQFTHTEARQVIASQWVRAMVRAAPLGREMWRTYRESPLYRLLARRLRTDLDLAVLATLHLNYESRSFEFLRRLGASA